MFNLTIKTRNAAFYPGDEDIVPYEETVRILRVAADKLERLQPYAVLFDINGNIVGEYELDPD